MPMNHYFHGNKQGYHAQLFFKMEQSNNSRYKRMAIMWLRDLSDSCTLGACLLMLRLEIN
jgi:hypothetical protein